MPLRLSIFFKRSSGVLLVFPKYFLSDCDSGIFPRGENCCEGRRFLNDLFLLARKVLSKEEAFLGPMRSRNSRHLLTASLAVAWSQKAGRISSR